MIRDQGVPGVMPGVHCLATAGAGTTAHCLLKDCGWRQYYLVLVSDRLIESHCVELCTNLNLKFLFTGNWLEHFLLAQLPLYIFK